jgi:hypothetical protein
MVRIFVRLIIFAICFVTMTDFRMDAAGPFHGQVGVAIERTFGMGNPDPLKPYIDDKNKTFLSIPIVNIPAGNYSQNQTLTLIRQLFDRVVTKSFYLQGGNLPNFERGPIRAKWKFYFKNTTDVIETTVYFTITSNPIKPIIKSIRGE